MDGSNKAFRVILTGEGAEKLREKVREKLKEFMGDYTDDTLVEYVIVLLRNGRQKEESRKELDVFLGDDSQSFVSWLWDHFAANSHLYMQSQETAIDVKKNEVGKLAPQQGVASGDSESNFDREKDNSLKARGRHYREWKGLAHDETEPLLLRSTIDGDARFSERHPSPVRKFSPSLQIRKKRNRQDESIIKREVASRPKLDAPRRLLQFAVMDAVRTSKRTAEPEPPSKRLRSVVSTSTVDVHSVIPLKRTRSVASVAGAAAAMKAAAEAAKDVVKVRGSGNVFDRLGRGGGRPYTPSKKHPSDLEVNMIENGKNEDLEPCSTLWGNPRRIEHDKVVGDMGCTTTMVRGAGITSDSASENEDFEHIHNLKRAADRSRTAEISSLQMDKDVNRTHRSSVQSTNSAVNSTIRNNSNLPLITGSNASQKTLNISINVNAWKPQEYQVSEKHKEAGDKVAVEGIAEGAINLNTQVLTGNAISIVTKKDETIQENATNEIQKVLPSSHGVYSGGRPADDADSRTVFVSNVHFAASKDDLSRHFNKFGEVLKVIIVTDATTGQPKGAAYVEFLRKESAEHALSLNGTSFMSRLLKVVTRSAAHLEAPAMFSWSRIARSSAYPFRLGRSPFPRGSMTSNLRVRLPLKPGPRSLQWKRENPGLSTNDDSKLAQSPATPGSATVSPAGRNLTYVRPEP